MTRHDPYCYADDGELDCICGLADEPQPEPWIDGYGDPLQDREPMGGDPYWQERDL